MSQIQYESLSNLASVITKGTTPTSIGYEFSDSGVGFLRVQNLAGGTIKLDSDILHIDETTHNALARSKILPNDVLVSIAGTIGRSAVVPTDAPPLNCNQAIAIVRTKQGLDPQFLRLWLNSYQAKSQIEGATVTGTISNLSLTQISNLKIPLLPLEVQRTVVSELLLCERLSSLRKITLGELDSYIRSLFIEMFGDPVTNPKSWPTKRIEGLIEGIESGKNVNPSENDDPNGLRVLKVSSVTWGTFDWTESKPLPPKYRPTNESHYVKKNDFLFSRANTTELVGAVTIVRDVPKNILLPDKLWRIKWVDSLINQEFAMHLLRHPSIREQLSKSSSGSSGSMKNISQGKFVTLEVPLPPLSLQSKFANAALSVEIQRTSLLQSDSELKNLFDSLLAESFSGTQ